MVKKQNEEGPKARDKEKSKGVFQGIYLEKANIERHRGLPKKKRISARIDIELGSRSTTRNAYVKQSFKVEGKPEGEDKPVFTLMFTLIAEYKVEKKLEGEELLELARDQGLNDIWPYAREYASNMTIRIGMPPLYLPPFIVEEMESRVEP